MAEQEMAVSVTQWRNALGQRCEALGWDVPQVIGMGGYLLNRLTRYVTEAECVSGLRPDIEPDGVAALGTFTGKPLMELRKLAEGLPSESAFDEDKVAAHREERERRAHAKMHADHMRQAEQAQTYEDIGDYQR